MTFQDPITTAEGVDTNADAPTGPGVRLYQGTAGGFPAGILEMRDGVNGDDHATLISQAFLSPILDGGGNIIGYTSDGRSTALDGGSANGTNAPILGLNVQPAAAGGYEAVATLTEAVRLETPAALTYTGTRGRIGVPNAYGTGWSKFTTANPGNTTHPDFALFRTSDGMIHAKGLFQYTGGAGAQSVIYTLPVDWRPTSHPSQPSRTYVADLIILDAFRTADVRANGQIALRGALPAGAGFASINAEWPGPDFVW